MNDYRGENTVQRGYQIPKPGNGFQPGQGNGSPSRPQSPPPKTKPAVQDK